MTPAEQLSASTAASPDPTKSPHQSIKRRILRGTFWSTVGRVVSIGSLMAGNFVLARAWEETRGDFAAYAVAAATVILLGFPASMGVPKILTRFIREGIHTRRLDLLEARLSSAKHLLLFNGAAVAAAMIVAPPLLQHFGLLSSSLKWQALTEHAMLTACWMVSSALCLSISQALMGFDDFKSAALVGARNGGVIANVGFLLMISGCWYFDTLTLATALWLQVTANLAALTAGVFFLRRAAAAHLPEHDSRNVTVADRSESGIGWLFQESWPNLIIQLTSMGIMPIELILLSSIASDGEIADYSVVQRLQEVLVGGQTLATTIVAPFITELYALREMSKLQTLLRGAATLVAIPTLACLALFLAFPAWSLEFFFGPAYVGGATALRIVSVGAAVACFAGQNGLTMIMTGRQRELLRASIAASIIYLLVAPPMILSFGIVGAATSISVVFGTYNLVVTLMIKSRMGIWTTPSLSPRAIAETLRQMRRRRAKPPLDA
jgi:O-antigen/teichoic acid export membrane protein